MKSIRNWKLVKHFGLAALALCSFAVLGNAQAAYQGKFTLPVEARWGGSVLPAGDYAFTLPSTAAPYAVYVRGEGKAAIIIAAAAETKVVSERPQLNLVNTGDGYAVRTLEAPALGLTFVYAAPAARTEGHRSSATNQYSLLVALRGESEATACTSYPEWSCESQAVPGQEAVSATTAATDDPGCTSYPEWSCEPQTQSNHERSKPHGQMAREHKSRGDVSAPAGGSDGTFERRPY